MGAVYSRGGLGAIATATNLTGLNSTTGLTVAFWHRSRPDSTASYNSDVFAQRSTANIVRDGFAIYFQVGGLNISLLGSAATTVSAMGQANTRFEPGKWAHYAITYDNVSQRVVFYKNGQPITSGSNTRVVTANAACTTEFGAGSYQQGANHSLFDFQYAVNTALNAADVAALMNPRHRDERITARYFGLGTGGYAASGVVLDETGNGFNVTANANAASSTLTDLPPFLPTLA